MYVQYSAEDSVRYLAGETDAYELHVLENGGVQHNLAFNYPFPLVIEKAQGAYLYDIDGNRYVDYLQAGGPT